MNENQETTPFIIYNLFPLLAGKISQWQNHLNRIADMGFNWIFLNPYHYPGFSGSIYSIKDYYGYHPAISEGESSESALRGFISKANEMGIKVMADLVINHTAIDSALTQSRPQWYLHENGKIKNPCVKEGGKVTVVWGDLGEIDNLNSPDRDNLWEYWLNLVYHYISLGFSGFRCDAAYQVPAQLWRHIITNAKVKKTDAVFFAENLGCELKDTKILIESGFDVIFNSSKWWDFQEPWCMKQYSETYQLAPSISFAESHDTQRLAKELNFDWDQIKTRYFFSSAFSSGVMMPIGFEYGFSNKLDVVKTTPSDWENTGIDLSWFIKSCNNLKRSYRILQNDNKTYVLTTQNKNIFAFVKESRDGKEKAFVIINKDNQNHQEFYHHNLYEVFAGFWGFTIKDISPEYHMDYINQQFHYNLRPSQAKILYSTKHHDTSLFM